MTYNEKRSLYESIMKEVSKRVKYLINETYNENENIKTDSNFLNLLYNTTTKKVGTELSITFFDKDSKNKSRNQMPHEIITIWSKNIKTLMLKLYIILRVVIYTNSEKWFDVQIENKDAKINFKNWYRTVIFDSDTEDKVEEQIKRLYISVFQKATTTNEFIKLLKKSSILTDKNLENIDATAYITTSDPIYDKRFNKIFAE